MSEKNEGGSTFVKILVALIGAAAIVVAAWLAHPRGGGDPPGGGQTTHASSPQAAAAPADPSGKPKAVPVSWGKAAPVAANAQAVQSASSPDTLKCDGRHYFFFSTTGTYRVTLQSFEDGGKKRASFCVEGKGHQCEHIIDDDGKRVWATGDSKVVNSVAPGDFIEVFNSDSLHGASGGTDWPCPDHGATYKAAIGNRDKMKVSLVVEKQ